MNLYINTSDLDKIEFKLIDGKKVAADYSTKLEHHQASDTVQHLGKFLKGKPPVTRISLYAGAGSYTGLRIGNAIAQALSLAWDVPLKLIK